jgi:hypothetical protein
MQFQIEIINVQATTKPTKNGSYVQLDVAYKKLADGKIEGKKIMSFANKDAYGVLSKATNGNQFTVTSEKEGEFWQWIAVTPLSASQTTEAPTKTSNGFVSPKSTYETSEERAKRQVLIVRQSSLSNAVNTLKTDKKELDPDLVMALAGRYNQWVFQEETPDMNFADMQDDVPC